MLGTWLKCSNFSKAPANVCFISFGRSTGAPTLQSGCAFESASPPLSEGVSAYSRGTTLVIVTIPALKSVNEYDLCVLLLWDLNVPKMLVLKLHPKNVQVTNSFFFSGVHKCEASISFQRQDLCEDKNGN